MADRTNVDPWKKLLAVSTGVTETGEQDVKVSDEKLAENMEFLNLALGSTAQGKQQGPCLFTRFFQLGGEKPEVLAACPAKIAAAEELAEELEDYLLLGNFTEKFMEADGIKALTNLTLAKNEQVRLLYLRLIPQIAENREEFQKAIAQSKLFKNYIDLLKDFENLKSSLVLSLLSAISSIVRSSEFGWKRFVAAGGVKITIEVIRSAKDDKVAARAAHLLYNIHFSLKGEENGTKYPYENKKWSEEEYSDEDELYEMVQEERRIRKDNEKKKAQRRELEKANEKIPDELKDEELPKVSVLEKTNASSMPSAPEKKKKVLEKFEHSSELINALFLAYIYIKSRIDRVAEEKTEDFDESVFDFVKDTFQYIQACLLNVDYEEMNKVTREIVTDYFKKSHRAEKLKFKKVEIRPDPVGTRFRIHQFFTKKEIVDLRDKEEM